MEVEGDLINNKPTLATKEAIAKRASRLESIIDLPEKIYRGISIDPSKLDEYVSLWVMKPWSDKKNKAWERIVNDGNEYGVYMSDNYEMVKWCYAGKWLTMDSPSYKGEYGMCSWIKMPTCSILYEIDTKKLPIRIPLIVNHLEWHYNNWFVWNEWISEEISSENYRICWLILSSHQNDRYATRITDIQPEWLDKAIKTIQEEYKKKLSMYNKFKAYLESLTDAQRKKSYLISKWKKENHITVWE